MKVASNHEHLTVHLFHRAIGKGIPIAGSYHLRLLHKTGGWRALEKLNYKIYGEFTK